MVKYLPLPEDADYLVGSDGSVWSRKRGRWRRLNPAELRGYPRVTICTGGKHLNSYVHQLVALVFLGPVPQGQEVRHRDGNRGNCRRSTLQYGTRKQNHADKKRHGTNPEGVRNNNAKLTAEAARDVRGRKGTEPLIVTARRHGISKANVSLIQNHKIWTHI